MDYMNPINITEIAKYMGEYLAIQLNIKIQLNICRPVRFLIRQLTEPYVS